MKCPKCNAEIRELSKYCYKCGEKIDNITIDNKSDHNEEHNNQYNYSKKYSNYNERFDNNRYNQYSYSSQYSKVDKYKITSDEDYIKNVVIFITIYINNMCSILYRYNNDTCCIHNIIIIYRIKSK